MYVCQGVGGPWDWHGDRVREEMAATLTPSFITALTPDTNSSQSGARLCPGKQGKGRAEKKRLFSDASVGEGCTQAPRPVASSLLLSRPLQQHTV